MEVQAHRRYLLVVALLLLLIQCGLGQGESLNSSMEWTALLDLRSSLGLRGKDWPIKANPCSAWMGIKCKAGRVVGITVSGLRRTQSGQLSPRFAVDALANFTSLVSFNASGFLLPGSIPDWFGQSLVALQVLDLRSSSIVGPIPTSIGDLSKLTDLYLSGNSLTGSMPSAIGQLSQLSVLDLSRNLLTGSIPPILSSLHNLIRLELASNFLSGPIPPSLGTLTKLQLLDLSDNSLTSSVPSELGNLSELLLLDLGKNSLTGALPVNLRGLRNLEKMYIGDNGLEGPLPDDLFRSLSQLEILVLRGNKLDGRLHHGLLSHPKLRFFDASNNNFTGSLPSFVPNSMAAFNFSNNFLYGHLNLPLELHGSIDLSGNYFQGVVLNKSHNAILSGNCLDMEPDQRDFEACSLFYSERTLTFEGFGKGNSDKLDLRHDENNRLKFIMVGLFGGLGFVVMFVIILVVLLKFSGEGKVNKRGKANVGPVPDGHGPSLPKDPVYFAGLGDSFTYEQLLHGTGNFCKDNLIKQGHSGDLYKGFLEGGLPVVIKKVNMQYLKNERYSVELDFFSKVSHMRFVPFLGHCFEREDEKLLVYKCMPNGDLGNCLQSVSSSEDDNVQSLDWIIRLKIAIGAAEALSYLHHECSPPLVHRDIQASSILLDDKFEVRLGSLSEACVVDGDQHQNAFTRLRRKPQSSEQCSSGSSPASCSQDVHCFGKVLLELVTGKLSISKAEEDATTKEWLEHTLSNISIHDKELVTQIVDPSLMIDDDLLEEVWAMAIIAKSCLNPKPSRRPLMRYILKALENPLKVVREELSSSGRLRTTSSRRSWSSAFHGSWRRSSSDVNRENGSGSKQPGRLSSHGSCGYDFSSSNKRISNEIVPEPEEFGDVERQD
ncbi:probable LRR receptor-like serine/threonine-protein kinase At2g16250 [Cucurbita pepo subsp. pepo]|uniref:probable LRR receptor-like serine/threonine-protein kinase At2g16250 n=1 Tax=Cucurbita pepo subsp. pepo TaxID=3664 RepID=UPI000C9D3305|nr:probable LRR receptor-like serine/threonine-protein kinase At2g16250 [Cucurbita pepo subsp. pepo]XP_023535629.1 probable LRR receptor-like serine/threonine-protein kinase At2g16250 [Cucurbita pepo subsp. pepo]